MRRFGCFVPASCAIYGIPQLSKMEGWVKLGERVMMCSKSYLSRLGLEFKCVLSTGKNGYIEIGDDSGINGTAIFAAGKVVIGKRVMIGGGTRIMDIHCHPVDCVPRRYAAETDPPKPVYIEDDVWIGMDVFVMPGVRIGKGSVIGAKSVVTKDIPPMVVAAGSPAKVIRSIDCPLPTDAQAQSRKS